jgi:hypothetical protein
MGHSLKSTGLQKRECRTPMKTVKNCDKLNSAGLSRSVYIPRISVQNFVNYLAHRGTFDPRFVKCCKLVQINQDHFSLRKSCGFSGPAQL